METSHCKRIFENVATVFKSYYVVWKRKRCMCRRNTRSSLNRTMQYGNYSFIVFYFILYLFKSYQVVWKLIFDRVRNTYERRFKSYYVVWKLFKPPIIFNIIGMFKSYYVVWKPAAPPVFVTSTLSLNRTMQYGNRFLCLSGFHISVQFKSYYVVWKHGLSGSYVRASLCLNRTMQYGNVSLVKLSSFRFKTV